MIQNPIYIGDYQSYFYCVQRRYEPLVDDLFKMDIRLRVYLQNQYFLVRKKGGKIDRQRSNIKFYKWVWDHKPHQCEETLTPLEKYSAKFVSHILTKGAYPEMAFDPRNTNILRFDKHRLWENDEARKGMLIYIQNMKIIELLKSEYNEYHRCIRSLPEAVSY